MSKVSNKPFITLSQCEIWSHSLVVCICSISTIIQFASLLAEFRFFLELTIYGMYLLVTALTDGIVGALSIPPSRSRLLEDSQ